MYFKLSESIAANNTNTHQQPTNWYLYIIENKLGQLYTGITTSPQKRIAQHRGEISGGARALKGKTPLQFKVLFLIGSRSKASKLECKVKRLTRLQKLSIIANKALPSALCSAYQVVNHHPFNK